ncbi:unnamed protein product (macronuclear) [Paramecium tetraurelia]|uniref:Uncharacterized protein n=1 Tax=Paramecium tetraurelia TaxID=5888 RepID=A0BN28_PARTE|nr:uncharacterized protein GSPATT00030583001 [Paramecium tetraurelia]CAK59945.1 unnamed protein product [Paramecium tetraurelia]|eukprot:XP_001427343.1 hypothetical protein (macronuclear) [Paramecium tetraurelia strain d4-2]
MNTYNNVPAVNQQQILEEDYKRRLQQRQQYLSMQQLIYDQNMMLNQLMYQQQYQQQMQQYQQNLQYQQQYQKPNQKPINVQIKSITLKPLEYYSQQMSSIHYPPYAQPYPQRQAVEIPPKDERIYGLKNEVSKRTIEVQTDDKITEYEKFLRMGLGNTINKQFDDNWGPEKDEQALLKAQMDQKYQGNFEMNLKNERELKERERELEQAKLYQRKRFKPPGMTKEQWAKINFKIFRDQFIYLALYFHRFRKNLDSRKQQALNQKGEQAIKCLQNFLEMFQKNSAKVIVQFSSNKDNLNITDKRKILEAEMKQRRQNIKNQTKKLFQTLISNFNAKDIKPETIEFLGSIFHNFEFPIQNFLFLFEINRLNFTHFGQLDGMTDIKAQCLLITLILIRVFLLRVILKPWAEFPDRVKKKELFEQNCYIVGSLMYEIIMDFLKSKWLKKLGNQSHLPSKYKTYPRPLGPLLSDNYQLPEDVAEVRQIRQLEEPLIMGLTSREDLKSILEDDKPFCIEQQNVIQQWAENIYKIVHQTYLLKQKQRRKERYENKVKFIEIAFFTKEEEKQKHLELAQQIYEKYESTLPQPEQDQT